MKLILVKINDMKYREMIRQRISEVYENMKNEENIPPKYLTGKGKADMVNHPPHYNNATIETIEAIESATGAGFEYYLQGNILKYLWRYRYKNGAEDLKKARWYLDRLINIKERNSNE